MRRSRSIRVPARRFRRSSCMCIRRARRWRSRIRSWATRSSSCRSASSAAASTQRAASSISACSRSVQGIVIRPNTDDLVVLPESDAVEITRPHGLALSDEHDRLLGGVPTDLHRLFDFAAWQRPRHGKLHPAPRLSSRTRRRRCGARRAHHAAARSRALLFRQSLRAPRRSACSRRSSMTIRLPPPIAAFRR